jgi:hypothetical protein
MTGHPIDSADPHFKAAAHNKEYLPYPFLFGLPFRATLFPPPTLTAVGFWDRTMKNIGLFAVLALVLGGCALVPVQDQTLKNANGGEKTCKQVGTGLLSASLGKSRFDDCVAKARADGYQ